MPSFTPFIFPSVPVDWGIPERKLHACICVEKKPSVAKRGTKKAVGIDVGIKHFLTDSEGRQIENPRFYERTLERIRVLHRNLSRKKKGSRCNSMRLRGE